MMYTNSYQVPITTIRDGSTYTLPPEEVGEERFFLAPFLVGGLAGTALGYGIANNNQINRPPYPVMPPVYYPPYPIYTTNYYY